MSPVLINYRGSTSADASIWGGTNVLPATLRATATPLRRGLSATTASLPTTSTSLSSPYLDIPLYISAPASLYSSNVNWTCTDEAQLNFGGGVAPYTLTLLNGSLPVPTSPYNFSTETLKLYGTYLSAGEQSVALLGAVGTVVRFAIVDANSSFALTPAITMQSGTGYCSSNSPSWFSAHKKLIAVLGFLGLLGAYVLYQTVAKKLRAAPAFAPGRRPQARLRNARREPALPPPTPTPLPRPPPVLPRPAVPPIPFGPPVPLLNNILFGGLHNPPEVERWDAPPPEYEVATAFDHD